jgi:hypothetical protein
MTEHDLVVGQTYYWLTYADPDWTMPGLKPMVYVGRNLFGSATEAEQLYFQDTVSVVLSGLASAESFGGQAEVFPVSPSEVGRSMVTLQEAAKQVNAALSRAMSLGNPTLKRGSAK